MKKVVVIFVVIFALMEGVSWWAYMSFNSEEEDKPETVFEREQDPISSPAPVAVSTPEQQQKTNQESISEVVEEKTTPPVASLSELPPKGMGSSSESFPSPSTEVVNGVTERTIHMGIRQYEWDPKIIRAKQGELVRLIIHNADVKHGIAIPELGVNEDISPDGAVVTFKATKKGTFEFFCSVWCGEGHMEMTAKLIIE